MKKKLLIAIFIFCYNYSNAQKRIMLPVGFKRAEAPAWVKEKVLESNIPLREAALPESNLQFRLTSTVTEEVIGHSYYDLQTNGSISNRLCVNDDGSISAAWTYSPNYASPAFPQRGTGYNFHDSNGWTYPLGPPFREESVRTGYPNIVVTPTAELIIAHASIGPTDSTAIIVSRRTGRGIGMWTTSYPWGTSFDAWPKACAAASSGINENVYVIFRGDAPAGTPLTSLYFSRSQDGGLTWSPKSINPLLIVPGNLGFGPDHYSIDARDSIVTIGFGNFLDDLGILKSTDYGVTWTKTILQQNIYPPLDTTYSNGGDIHVLIDNAGMVHAWFSSLVCIIDTLDTQYLPYSDGLEYWNESMGSNSYVEIAATQDFNGNGIIDFPHDTSTSCSRRIPCGDFGAGLTIQPSAGIDASGVIYLSYSAIDETTYPGSQPVLLRHVYMMQLSPPYNPSDWTYPSDIIPDTSSGGNGIREEGVFACTGKRTDNNYVYVLYERDGVAGHSLAPAGTCDAIFNANDNKDLILASVDKSTLNVPILKDDELFISQNRPNPATALTYFDVGLNRLSNIRLEVFDAIGKKVYSEERKNIQPGSMTLSIEASKLKPGIYFYCVTANGLKKTRRMIVQ